MPKSSAVPYKLPREKGNPAMQPAQSKMCYDCGKVTGGRHEGAHFMVARPHDYHYIDDEGLAYNEEERKAMGAEANVSHGECPQCLENAVARQKALQDARLASERAMKAAADETNRDIGQTTAAYIPLEEAHTPLEQAHTSLHEAHAPIPQPAIDSPE